MTARILSAALLCTFTLAACGEDEREAVPIEGAAEEQTETTATDATTTTPKSDAPAAPKAEKGEGDTDLSKKPKVAKGSGDEPTELKVEDIVVGKGPAAKAGDQLSVRYVGVRFADGGQFDASWDRGGAPFQFQVGQGMVIPGWDQGLVGMKVGGRRKLTIPSDLAYGPQGTPDGSIPPDAALIFVVDLKKIG